MGLGLHGPSCNPVCQPEDCTVHFLLVSPTAASHWPLAAKSCVQLPMHKQGRIQEKLHSNPESFFRHVNSQKILSEAQPPYHTSAQDMQMNKQSPGKPQEMAFKLWPNGESINWNHQVKICFSETGFVTPPPAPLSNFCWNSSRRHPCSRQGVGIRRAFQPKPFNDSVI